MLDALCLPSRTPTYAARVATQWIGEAKTIIASSSQASATFFFHSNAAVWATSAKAEATLSLGIEGALAAASSSGRGAERPSEMRQVRILGGGTEGGRGRGRAMVVARHDSLIYKDSTLLIVSCDLSLF